MSTQGFDVAVVGAGIGGLAAAALLARAGRAVVLLERAAKAGGVCQSLECEGYRFDIGATHLTGVGSGGPLATLCERLGISLPIKECDPVLQVALPQHRLTLYSETDRWWPEVRREFPDEEAGWQALIAELDGLCEERDRALQELPPLPPEGWREHLRVWRVLSLGGWSAGSRQHGRILKGALATPFRATMARHGLGLASQRVLDASLWYLLFRGAAECSTLEAAVALRGIRQGAATVAGGLTTLVDALLGQFQQDGGQLRLQTEAAHCALENGRVVGVATAGGETIRAGWVVSGLPPGILAGRLLPPRRGWLGRRHPLDGPWRPLRVAEVMALAVPETLIPSELRGNCVIVQDVRRPARDENVVFVRAAPPWDGAQAPPGIRSITVGRFVAPRTEEEDRSLESELVEALDQVIPGVAGGMVYHRALPSNVLGEMWGRPSGAVRYGLAFRDWLGQRGLPHRTAWPGLLVVGEWTYPGRTISNVVEGAMRVVDVIAKSA